MPGGAPGLVPYEPPTFTPPSPSEIYNDPSYQQRLAEGQGALERSAAAKGLLRTGGTLKDILKYGQDYGAQEYQNIFQRALQGYGTQQQNARDRYQAAWEQYVFANTPRGGGGGRGGDDIPPPPEAPPGDYVPDEPTGAPGPDVNGGGPYNRRADYENPYY